MEEDPFCIDRMAKTVSAPSEASVHLAQRTPQASNIMTVLMREKHSDFQLQICQYKINMQTRYAAARATVTQYTRPVPFHKNTFSPYGDSDEDSDGPPPSPKKTDATEMKTDKSLQVFIEALPHLEPLHYGFKLQASNEKAYCFCALAKCLSPWRKKHHVDNDYSVCGARHFQGPGLLQHCCDKGDEYHTATAFYLSTLFKNEIGLTQAAVHHGTNNQSRKTADANALISGCYYQSVDSQESDHPYQRNESIVDNACDTVGEEKNDAFTSVEQEFQGNIGVHEQINAENQAKDVQAESIFANTSEIKDTSTLSGQELPGQCAHDNDGVNSVDKATDANGDPSKDSDHAIDAENTTVDKPDYILDSVEVNTVSEAKDTNGHPSQESDVTVDAEKAMSMSLILFMTVPKQLTQMLSRQYQLLFQC